MNELKIKLRPGLGGLAGWIWSCTPKDSGFKGLNTSQT